jgi:hypothetical protein
MKEYQKQQDDYEEMILKEFNEMKSKRETQVKDLVFKLKTLSRLDKGIEDLYCLIEPISEAYCLGYINYYAFDEITYNKIFAELKTIKINPDVIECLKTIILLSE